MRSKHVTPVPTARVNVDKVTVEEAIELLASEGIEAKSGDLSDDAIQIERGNVAHTEAFKKDFFLFKMKVLCL